MMLVSFLRSLISAVIFVFTTLILALTVILLCLLRGPRNWVDEVIVWWGVSTLFLFNIKVVEINKQNIPKTACIYLFNHTSFFDVFTMVKTLKGMRFGAKIELFSIPIFGQAIRIAGVLPIARQSREEVFKVYENAIKIAISKGQQYALAPEGTRQSDEGRLGPFKAGPFVFALQAQILMVPVVIRGASKVLPKNGILPNWDKWQRTISIEYLTPIDTTGKTVKDRHEFQKQINEQMSARLTAVAPKFSIHSKSMKVT